jgi:hypothetical protein
MREMGFEMLSALCLCLGFGELCESQRHVMRIFELRYLMVLEIREEENKRSEGSISILCGVPFEGLFQIAA